MGARGWAFVLVAVTALTFANTASLGFVWDDHRVIEANPAVTDPGRYGLRDALRATWWGPTAPVGSNRVWRPVTLVSFRVDRALWGPSPSGHHVTNVALHALVAALVFALARRVLLSRGADSPLAAFGAAALFALHPLRVEAVASIVGRAELLAALGVLTATLATLRATEGDAHAFSAPEAAWRRVGWAMLAVLGCALGVGAKENAVVAPVWALAVAAFVARREGEAWRRAVSRALPAVAPMGLVLGVWWLLRANVVGEYLPRTHVQAIDNPLLQVGAGARVLTALALQARYLALTVFPWSLSADYSFEAIPVVRSVANGWLVASVVMLVAFARVARRRAVLDLGAGLYLLAFLPTANLVLPIHVMFAERLTYLPAVGLSVALAWALARVEKPWVGRVFAAVLVVFALRSALRNADWESDATLFLAAREVTPGSARVRNNAGAALMEAGSHRAARDEFREAVRIAPEYGDAWINLGIVELRLDRPREALRALERARAITPGHPALVGPLTEARARVR